MTKPTTLADNKFSSETLVPRNTDGGDKFFSSTLSVPSATAATSIFGMLRFFLGDRIQITSSHTDDLDTTTNAEYDIGYAYDDNTAAGADDDNAFLDGESAQAAASIGAAGLLKGAFNFVAAGDGYLTVTIAAGPTTTTGDIIVNGVIGRS